MEHLVKFQSAEGREGQHTAASLDDALRFVERLRNNEDASDVHVFRMHEIPIEFKTYFKVEVRPGDDAKPGSETDSAAEGTDTITRSPLTTLTHGPEADPDASNRRLLRRS